MTSGHPAAYGRAPRVLLLIGSMDSGGSQTQARLLLENLRSRGIEACVGCYRGAEDVFLSLRAAGVRVEILPRPIPLLWPLQIYAALSRLVRRHRITVVHAFLEDFVFLAPPLRLLHPRLAVVTSRRSLASYMPHRRMRLMAWGSRWASALVANSSAVAESVRRSEGDFGVRLTVVPNGIPLPPPVRPEERRQAREEFGVDPGAFVVAYVAHFRHGKGHDRLPKIARRVAKSVPHAVFLLAGRTEGSRHYRQTYARFRTAVESLGLSDRFLHLGVVPNSRAVLAASDALLNFSDSEGMSNSVMEAMALGVPVVATDVGGTPELVRDGRDGWIVAAGDGDEAADRLTRLAADPDAARRMGDSGRTRIERDFSVAKMVEAYVEIYARSGQGRSGRRAASPARATGQ